MYLICSSTLSSEDLPQFRLVLVPRSLSFTDSGEFKSQQKTKISELLSFIRGDLGNSTLIVDCLSSHQWAVASDHVCHTALLHLAVAFDL